MSCWVFRFFRGAGAVRPCCLGWPGRGTLCRLQPSFQPVSVERVVHRGRVGKDRGQAGRIVGIALGMALKLLQRGPALGRAAQAHATHLVGQADASVR